MGSVQKQCDGTLASGYTFMRFFVCLVFTGIIFIICAYRNVEVEVPPQNILGVWVYDHSESETRIYKKSGLFEDNKPGLAFKRNGQAIIRKNISFCGTPPITYANYSGFWKMDNDSLLSIKYLDRDRTRQMSLKVLKVDSSTLQFKRYSMNKN